MRNPRTLLVSVVAAVILLTHSGLMPAVEPNEIDLLLRTAVERGDVRGVVAMAATSRGIVYQGAFGKRCVENNEDMTVDSVFRIASMTKAVTSVVAMQLVDEGKLRLETPVSQHIAALANPQVLVGIDAESKKLRLRPASKAVTVKHLLTHTAGFGYEFWDPLLREAVDAGLVPSIQDKDSRFLQAPLVCDPDTEWHYGINTDWLGRLIETVRGASLEQVFAEHLCRPLKMSDTHFSLPANTAPRLVAHCQRQTDGTLVERARATNTQVTFCSGGGGLYATAPDYMRFLRALLRGGELDGAQILNAATVALMGRNHIGHFEAGRMRTIMPQASNDVDFLPGSINRFGFGFLINTQPVLGGRAAGSLAWAGIFNTYFWLDPTQDVCGVLMTQVLPFYDSKVVELLNGFERAVYRQVGAQATLD